MSIAAALAAAALLLAGAALRPRVCRGPAPRAARSHRPRPRPSLRVPSVVAVPNLARRRARRQRQRAAADLPDALELVVLAIRAGHLPAAALRATLVHLPHSVRPAFAAVVDRVDAGDRFADAIDALSAHLGDDALVLVDSFAAADRYGLPLAPVLERIAAEARQQRARRAATLARQLPVRLAAPLVLCTLPSFILLAVVPLLLAALSSLRW